VSDAANREPAAAAPSHAAAHRRGLSLHALLLALPLLVLVPLLLYSGSLLYLIAGQGRERVQQEQAAAQAALATTVQRELDAIRTVLEIVAGSPGLGEQAVDAQRIESLMGRVLQSGVGLYAFAVLDRQGRVVLQHPTRLESPPAVRLLPQQEEAFRTGKPTISDLHDSVLDGAPAVSINVPVRRGGATVWLLTARLDPGHLSRVLARHVLGREALVTVLDGNRRVLARTRDIQRFFGQMPSAQTLQALDAAHAGVQRFPTRDGNEYQWTWSTLPNGWAVLLGTPAREIDQALRGSMLQLATGGLLMLLLGLGATTVLARRISRSVDRIVDSAPALAKGERLPRQPTGIRQLDTLNQSLHQASIKVVEALGDRDRALGAERIARAAADEDNRAKDVFIATLSHELRNPLSPIRSAARVLKSPRADDAARNWAIDVIERQVGAMARLLEDLLDVSRITSGRIVLERQVVQLRTVLESAVEVARPLMESRRHQLSVALPSPRLRVDGDPVRLAQVFGNLLTNAAKYTDPGGRVELETAVHDTHVEVRVRDSGIGLPPDALERVFQMFAQVSGSVDRSQGGLGIGLALVRGLVEMHGGEVRAESAGVGRGSTFTVTLPLAPQAEEEAAPDGPAGAAAGGALRILVVDDNEDAADSLELLLRLDGHDTRVAHRALDGLQLAQSWHPDVACLDIGLPDLSGYELARRIRAQPWGARMRLIAITGWGTADDERAAREAGFDAHLAKPADPDRLQELLHCEDPVPGR
jgi:signal transduction histidine kinase